MGFETTPYKKVGFALEKGGGEKEAAWNNLQEHIEAMHKGIEKLAREDYFAELGKENNTYDPEEDASVARVEELESAFLKYRRENVAHEIKPFLMEKLTRYATQYEPAKQALKLLRDTE